MKRTRFYIAIATVIALTALTGCRWEIPNPNTDSKKTACKTYASDGVTCSVPLD